MKRFLGVALVLMLASVNAQAQQMVFLEIPGIPGESLNADYVNTIEVSSWSQTVANVGGPPVVMPLRFEHFIDRATPKLIEAALLNTNLGDVVLSVVRFDGQGPAVAYIEVTLSDTQVAAVEAINATDGVPTEQVTLTCSTFSMSYRRQLINGSYDSPIVVQGGCQ